MGLALNNLHGWYAIKPNQTIQSGTLQSVRYQASLHDTDFCSVIKETINAY